VSGSVLHALAGVGAAGIVALLAQHRRALSWSGVAAATVLGGIIVAVGGWAWGALLVAFFVTSSTLSIIRKQHREHASITARGHQRDAVQVIANGGIAMAAAVMAGFSASPYIFITFAGAIAAANADTWSTELGGLSTHPPRLITSGRRVSPGTSGGVTLLGLVAGVLGSVLIGVLAAGMIAAGWIQHQETGVASIVAIIGGGIAGTLLDSVLGATVQALYVCPVCGIVTERKVHGCGTVTRTIRGWEVMNNDVVNALATLCGAAVACVILRLL
jgi:uncharacterized protein (TIGR00297 family)